MKTYLPTLSSLLFIGPLLLLNACDGGGSSTADTRVDPISEFRADDWQFANKDGAEVPRADSGRLRLESINPTGPNPTASIGSKVTGQYSDFGAKLTLARQNTATEPADYQAFLSLDIVGTTTGEATQSGNSQNEVGTKARVGLRATGSNVDLVTQVLDATGNPIAQRVRSIGSFDADGETQLPSAEVRLQLDQDQEIIRFFSNGQLEFTFVPTTLELPTDSTIGVVAEGRKFLVFAEDFLAIDVSSATTSFSYESSAIAPSSTNPGTVRFLFTLRDQTDQVLNVPESQLLGANLMFAENGEPIDRVEANPIFKRANLPQDVVIVLDYSASLSNQPGGIDTMVAGAKALADGVWGLNPTNRVQFWEFHDSFTPATVLVPQPPGAQGNWLFAAQRVAAFTILDTFAPYNGFSRVFDAVNASTASFTQAPRTALRSVAFLTDGFDTGSNTDADDLISIANNGNIALYPIAIGSSQPKLRELRRIAANTRGNVYPVPDITDLVVAFGELGGDLDSLYSASYVSSRDTGPVQVSLNIDLLLTGASTRQTLPVAASANVFVVSGDTRVGWLDFQQTSFVGTTATVLARATFVPRTVDTFSIGNFSLSGLPTGTTPTVAVSLPSLGLLAGWSTTTTGTVTTATGPTLGFGDFGAFIELTISNIPAAASQFTLTSVIQNGDLAPVGFITVQPGSFVPPTNWQFDVTLVRPPSTP